MRSTIRSLFIVVTLVVSRFKVLAVPSPRVQQVSVDASSIIGQLKNLQGTNNGEAPVPNNLNDNIHDVVPEVQQHWKDSAVKDVMIYTFPDVFLGFGKSGTAGDPYLIENYNFTEADKRVRFVLDGGAQASAQFQESGGYSSSPEILEGIGFMLADRYSNGAHNSGFKDAVTLWDFYPERDNQAPADYQTVYDHDFSIYSAFAKGVARANPNTTGCGAFGYKRLWTPSANYTVPDPWKTQFFNDVAKNNVPIKAATFHWDAVLFSWDAYEIVTATKQFRELYLIPAGLPNLPIWITEYNRNPLGYRPTSPGAIASYDDPASFAAWVTSVSIYGQDAYAEQAMSWTGLGYGGYGYGNAYFEAWYTKTATGDVPTNAGAAWVLSGNLVTNTPNRLALTGSSENGFGALAGISSDKNKIQVFLNNYQVNYDVVREIAQVMSPFFLLDHQASPTYQPNGLFNGEQVCLSIGGGVGCLTFTQATIRNNTADTYRVTVRNLPWSGSTKYNVVVQRVGGGQVHQIYKNLQGKGNLLDLTLDFPPNAQDLLTITKA